MFDSLKTKFTSLIDNVSQKTISEKDINDVLWDFQLSLLENDVSMKVSEKLGIDLREQIVGEQLSLSENKKKFIRSKLVDSIYSVLQSEPMDLFELIEQKSSQGMPLVLIFIGFNGTGKTTTIAKLGHIIKKKGYSVVISASDTFRAGSIEQLEKHASNVGIKVIKHDYGADPAAVAFDAIKHAKARNIDVVLVDTAGRSETNKNLMDEMKKIIRVTNPDLKVFVGDALGGNAVVEQAEKFHEVGIDCSIITKVDADARGGSALSIAYVTKRPILFIGVGQSYDDLLPFDPKWMVERLLS
ncbi:MAG: signal recognition particle-docking protein FtsY [Candidatus Methanofastidiosa archaeon]|nr:signal recognition particle-docking protein FtsY [Candidatus Methanofastidiosa archaeon]